MSMWQELAEGPLVVARLLDVGRPAVARVAQATRERGIEFVMIAARGTSDHAAIYAQYVLGSRNRLPVALATPSLVSLYGTPPRLRRALVLGISQSGRSPDLVAVLEDARRQGATTVAITNDPASALAAAAEFVLLLGAGPELAVAATKTYLAEVAVVALLSAAISDAADDGRALAEIPRALEETMRAEDVIVGLAAARVGDERCAVLGRGYHYATAREWSLKLKELDRVLAEPYSAADFEHGPIALVGPGFPILAVATAGRTLSGMAELLARLAERGARILVLSDEPDRWQGPDVIPIPPVAEWLSPLVASAPVQLYAYHLALARGLDPETPQHLAKITLTN